MKKRMLFASVALSMLAASFSSCSSETDKSVDYASYVNPMIGTGGHGHTYPGPTLPNGMIQPSPDTRINGWDACSGYYFADSLINGFAHTHLNGTGCADYGDVLLMPVVGPKDTRYMGSEAQNRAYASHFSHDTEVAEPGYYAVTLDRYGVRAELTATKRAALHRYTFPASDESGFILDLDYAIQGQKNSEMEIKPISDTELVGHKKTKYWAFDQYINFYAKFSKPFKCTILNDTVVDTNGEKVVREKALLTFPTKKDEQVLVKVGVSAVDEAGARKNVEAEIPDWNFDKIRKDAREAWNQYLSKIDIETPEKDKREVFYTSLYHTGMQPNLFTDVDGRYLGMDLKVKQGDTLHPMYTIYSLWDTFRAFHPLMTIIQPTLNDAFIRSLLQKSKEGGVLPMWELAGNYTGTMIGYHAVALLADAYAKGSKGFDLNDAYKAALRIAEYDTTGIHTPKPVVDCLMPPAKYWKNKVGYVPCDKDNEAVAKGLEYAYNDWCVARLAEAVGDTANEHKYDKFAEAYKIYFDPSTRFMRGKDLEGNWRTPFNPRASNHRNDDYCEGTAWQWTWFVPQDVDGLVQLMGGKKAFSQKLDSLFTASSKLDGNLVSADITGLIGQYAQGNEPSHHIIHLYNYIDEPYKTQQLCDSVLQTLYTNQPDGLSGNEDCGQMSAWYILNSMGLYQVCPGNPVYSIGRPLFNKVTVHLENGKDFTIIAKNNSKKNKYIQKMTFNGKPLDKPFITHQQIMDGGTLECVMGDTPQYDYSK